MNDPPPTVNWRMKRDLRRWQHAAMEEWLASGQTGIVKVVTGGGKTVFAQACMSKFMAENPQGLVIILVPTLSLLDQWWVSLQEDLGVQEGEIALYSGGKKPAEPSPVNLLVINTGRTWAPRLALHGDALLIVDECHRAGSRVNALALEGSYRSRLGISATPERETDEGFDDALVPALGPVIYEYGYNEAARDGVIAPFDLINVQVALSDTEQIKYESFSRRIGREMHRSSGGDEQKLKRLLLQRAQVSAQARMRIPVAVKLVERYPSQRALVFHERIDAAEEIHRLLLSRGHASAIYHSRLDPALRRDNLRQYRRGVFQVLVTCRALDEGIDVPETALAVIASSTASSRQRIQRLGRALRPSRAKSHATVATIFATEQERSRLATEERDLVEARTVTWEQAKVDG